MRLVTFRPTDGRPRAGVLIGAAVIDLEAAAPLVFDEADDMRWDMLSILRGGDDGSSIDAAEEIALAVVDQLGGDELFADDASISGDGATNQGLIGGISIGGAEMVLPLSTVRLLAPLPRPASLRDFYAFEDHVANARRSRGGHVPPAWYDFPVFYFSNHGAIYGPDDMIPLPRTNALDYELEIACVIGREGRNIAEEDAVDYIAGYTILNDWSARDVQREEMSVGLGPAKGKDFATSLGPWLATPNELDHVALPDGRFNLTMVARVNGVERSRGNFRDIFYTFAQMIARASDNATLYPGDVLGSGTVGTGCLLELTEGNGPWLKPGDTVELEITALGTLTNRISEPALF